ncbi:hypothetical protein ACIBF5_29740 [Micromonospora sp. NPDC050417]|uniref:hypothetical protein n=1 Tax=Micromonospora sp. NPDC050417 TaxID=3364280 RepID=UPI003799E98D
MPTPTTVPDLTVLTNVDGRTDIELRSLSPQQVTATLDSIGANLATTAIAAPDAPQYATSTAHIAAALRRAADAIAALGNVELSPIQIGLNLQVVVHGNPDEMARVATTNVLNRALIGRPGELNTGIYHHSTPYEVLRARHDMNVNVFTALPELEARETHQDGAQ